MNKTNLTNEEARELLKQEALKEIRSVSDFIKFHGQVFCVIAKYGFQLKAKEKNLLSGHEWSNPAFKDILLEKVEHFLDKNIKEGFFGFLECKNI